MKMKAENIKKVGVLGAGIMGHGITQVCAQAGCEVVLRDVDPKFLDKGVDNIKKSIGKFVEKGKIQKSEADAAIGRIKTATKLADLKDADFIIEAIPENLGLKKETFAELDKICKAETIFASNTSQLSITAIATSARPAKFIGMHWFNPPQLMRLIEVIRGLLTSDETLQVTLDFSKRLGKETVVCKDSQGFITTRAINAFRNECIRIYEEGIASIEDIDKAIKLAFNHPMGPFELADFGGLDTILAINEAMTQVYGDRFRPPQTMRKMVAAGHYGRKSGKGFYDYTH
jgi:3-hydroxybutyryl-CoA dehydrogenase